MVPGRNGAPSKATTENWYEVPDTRPVEEARLSPAGSVPEEIDQVYGEVPPVACRARE